MKTNKNKFTFNTLFVVLLFVLGFSANSQAQPKNSHESMDNHNHDAPVTKTISGKLSGFDCAVVGQLCPTTHRGADYTVGVMTDDGTFYHLVNVPQSFFGQYFLETVEVKGNVYPPYQNSVEPEEIHLISSDDQRMVYEAGYFIDENNRRTTFQNGVFRDDRWVVE